MTYTRKCERCGGDGWDMGLNGPYMCMTCKSQGTVNRQVDFEYAILARVEFTVNEVHHLTKMSQTHHHSVCRDASTVPGGCVFEMHRKLNEDWTAHKVTVKLSLHELGILDRLLEMPGADPKLRDTITSIRDTVRAKQLTLADADDTSREREARVSA